MATGKIELLGTPARKLSYWAKPKKIELSGIAGRKKEAQPRQLAEPWRKILLAVVSQRKTAKVFMLINKKAL